VLDLGCSLFMLAWLAVMLIGYSARVYFQGRTRHRRLDGGEGKLLGRPLMESAYWLMGPVVNAALAIGATPNGVTLASLLPAAGAAVALGMGHFGIGSVLMAAASLCDLVDGVLARRLGTTSDAGEVVDASTDRYVEFFVIAGLVVHYRSNWWLSLLALATLLASFMISYSTAKAEALLIPPPKGLMRRAERAVYLGAGITFVPVVAWLLPPRLADRLWLHDAPMILAMLAVAVIGNVSAISRTYRLTSILRQRAQARPTSFTSAEADPPVARSRARAR
jgi:phosphatidylglycerophosphate synthase